MSTDNDQEKKELFLSIERAGRPITQKLKEKEHRTLGDRKKRLGLCFKCENLQAMETEFGTVIAVCKEFHKRLNAFDPVKNCTQYWGMHDAPLRDLIPIAWDIKADKKAPIGFITENDEYEVFDDEDMAYPFEDL